MTIAIGAILPDGVLLVTDGLETAPVEGKNMVTSKEKLKIHQLTSNLMVALAGNTTVTQCFLEILGSNKIFPDQVEAGMAPDDILSKLDKILADIWSSASYAHGIDSDSPSLIAAIGIAGIANGVPFIGHTTRTRRERKSYCVSSIPEARFVLGGSKFGSEATYLNNERHFMNGAAPGKPLVSSMIDAAVKTIKEVSKLDDTIGGQITYAFFHNTTAPEFVMGHRS